MKTKYLLVIRLLVFVLMFSILSFATPANTAVTLFSDVNQGGTPTYLTLSNYDLPALETLGYINDSAKSVKIKNGYVAYLYQHINFNTNPRDENGFIYRLDQDSNTLPEQYINQVSSVKIYSLKDEPTPTPEPLITPTPTPTPEPELPPTGGGGEDYMGFVILICLVLLISIIMAKSKKE